MTIVLETLAWMLVLVIKSRSIECFKGAKIIVSASSWVQCIGDLITLFDIELFCMVAQTTASSIYTLC